MIFHLRRITQAEILKWAKQRKYRWNSRTCIRAALGGSELFSYTKKSIQFYYDRLTDHNKT